MIKINGNKVIFEQFPNKETLFKNNFKNLKESIVVLDFKYEEDSDIVKLMLVKN